jgi:hypothetical protein
MNGGRHGGHVTVANAPGHISDIYRQATALMVMRMKHEMSRFFSGFEYAKEPLI